MILTITLNPLLERRLHFKQITHGASNRAFKEFFTAGGKGINVSRQLNCLGIKNSALTFVGGAGGKMFRSLLAAENIDSVFVSSKSYTREASITFDESAGKLTTYFGLNAPITAEEASDFKSRLDKAIQNCSIVILSGSSPCAETDGIFPYAISLANEHDKISILDTYGAHLNACIEQGPTVIHNNVKEIESSLGMELKTEDDKIGFMESLYKKGIRMSFITDGHSPAYASKFDFHYKVISPRVVEKDSCGSGDSFTAGIAYGLEEALVFEDFLKTASALGAANAASYITSAVSLDTVKEYYNKIEVLPIGKKMKIIDDRPTIY